MLPMVIIIEIYHRQWVAELARFQIYLFLQESNLYNFARKSDQPPHIFAVADTAYQNMVGYAGRTPANQCVLIR